MKAVIVLLFTASCAGAQTMAGMPGMQMPSSSNRAPTALAPLPDPSPLPVPLTAAQGRAPMTLDQWLVLAHSHNPTLRAAEAKVAESAGAARQAGLWPNPVAGYEGGQIRGGSFGGGEHGGFVQQTIPLGGKLGLRRDAYRAQQTADALEARAQSERVEADIESGFYAALELQQEVAVRQRLHEVAADAVETAKQLANVGQADAPDILQAEVEAEQTALDTLTAGGQYIAAFRRLAALAGVPELPLAPLAGDLESEPAGPSSADALVAQSPAVARSDQAVHVAEARLRAARREMIPDLTLRAGEQWNGELVRQNPNVAAGPQSFVSATVDLPLWNRNQGRVAAAKAALEIAQAEAERARLAVHRDAAPLVEQYNTAAIQATRYRDGLLPRAERAFALYRNRYHEMAAAYPQVLLSQRTLFELQLNYVRALGEMQESAARLRHFTLEGALDSVTEP